MAQNYVLLETIDLTQSASSVIFDNIPQTGYTDLKIVMSTRDTYSGTSLEVFARFNNNTGSVYTYKRLVGNGATAVSAGGSDTKLFLGNHPGSTATSNTFSNTEIYLPNYTSSATKSISVDFTGENNATTAYTIFTAGITSDTTAINRIDLLCQTAFDIYSTFSLYGVAATGTTPVTAPFATGGNIVANDGTYWYHAFLSSGTFTPTKELSCDILQVAGGGSGGAGTGTGGGGAGGMLEFTSQALTAIAYTAIVGAGGAGAGESGSNSQFASLTASVGGGRGGNQGTGPAGSGGSGGGGAYAGGTNASVAGSGTAGQGSAGGNGQDFGSNSVGGGGGGGKGGAGQAAQNSSTPGLGGAGAASAIAGGAATLLGELSSGSYYFAGGGGGASVVGASGRAGGVGGGGRGGGAGATTPGIRGTGGGGGGNHQSYTQTLGNGGSGVIVIRYAMV
jgi:hypothetical protein